MAIKNEVDFPSWFDQLWKLLNEDKAKTIVASGAACEHWINFELFNIIAEYFLKSKYTVQPEWGKKDLAIYEINFNEQEILNAFIEIKVVYANYSAGTCLKDYLNVLTDQLLDSEMKNDIKPDCHRYGLYFCIFFKHDPKRSQKSYTDRKISFEKFKDFHTKIFLEWLDTLNKKAKKAKLDLMMDNIDSQKPLKIILEESPVQIGGRLKTIGILGQYVKLLPR